MNHGYVPPVRRYEQHSSGCPQDIPAYKYTVVGAVLEVVGVGAALLSAPIGFVALVGTISYFLGEMEWTHRITLLWIGFVSCAFISHLHYRRGEGPIQRGSMVRRFP